MFWHFEQNTTDIVSLASEIDVPVGAKVSAVSTESCWGPVAQVPIDRDESGGTSMRGGAGGRFPSLSIAKSFILKWSCP